MNLFILYYLSCIAYLIRKAAVSAKVQTDQPEFCDSVSSIDSFDGVKSSVSVLSD